MRRRWPITLHSEVVRSCDAALKIQQSPAWEESTGALAEDHSAEGLEAYQYQFESPRIRVRPEFAEYALESFTAGRPMREALMELTARIYRDFTFDSSVTTVHTPTEEVFKKRRGVCQDFAHVQIACLRSINIAARYVSGYLRTYSPPVRRDLLVQMRRMRGSPPTAEVWDGSTWTGPTM